MDSKSNFDNPEHSCNFFGDSKINLSNNSYDKITLYKVDDIIRSILMVAGLPQKFEIKKQRKLSSQVLITLQKMEKKKDGLLLINLTSPQSKVSQKQIKTD